MLDTFKKIWPALRVYRGRLALVISLGIILGATQSSVAPLLGRLIRAWDTHNEKEAWMIPAALAVIWLLGCVARYFHLSIMKYTADRISVSQRRLLMDKYLSLNISFFQDFEKGAGGLISRMVNDINIIQSGIHKLADVMREPITILGLLGFVLYKDWRLTVFILIALPIVTAALRQIAKSLRKYSRHNQEIMEDLTRTLKESLDGTRIVQSFGLEGEMRQKFNRQADEYLANRKKIISREEAAGPISEALTVIFISCVLVYIGQKVFSSGFSTASFLEFITALGFMLDSIRKLQDGYIKMQQAGVAIDRLDSIMNATPAVRSPERPVPFPAKWLSIEFRNVSFAFKEELVLRKVNLTVQRSETLALVGSSGSGKSTLVNLLQRFFDPTEGEVLIDGINIKNFSLADLRRNIALVTQDVFLFHDTIEKNILMGNLAGHHDAVVSAATLANAHQFITNTPNGYMTSVGDFGNRMSGGEKQRISIARAILKDSPILVLDEATSALDSESELEVQKGLSGLLAGRTAFVIAHRLSTIAKANRIVVLKKGEIVEQGSHNQLLEQKGEYFKFHQMQFAL